MNWQEQMKAFDETFKKAMAKSKALPDGLVVGKLFSMNVADGRAWYEVTKVNKTTVRIAWHEELCPDGYQDMALGEGGSFPRAMIERIVVGQEQWSKMMERING